MTYWGAYKLCVYGPVEGDPGMWFGPQGPCAPRFTAVTGRIGGVIAKDSDEAVRKLVRMYRPNHFYLIQER